MELILYFVFLIMSAVAFGTGIVSIPHRGERVDISYIVGLLILFLVSGFALTTAFYFIYLSGFLFSNLFYVSVLIASILSVYISVYKRTKSKSLSELENEESSAGLIILSILIPLAGVILGIVKLHNKKSSGVIYLRAGIISWIVNIILTEFLYQKLYTLLYEYILNTL